MKSILVGFGSVAQQAHHPALLGAERIKICAVSDPRFGDNPKLRASARELFPRADLVQSLPTRGAVGDRTIEAAIICTPSESHLSLIGECLHRGWHVLCEKPIVGEQRELARLFALAKLQGLQIHVVHNWLHAPMIVRARQVAMSGVLGTIESARWVIERRQPALGASDWRDSAAVGAGILLDHGWHAFYCLAHLLGDWPATVVAQRQPNQGGPDLSTVVQFTANGVAVEVNMTWEGASRRTALLLHGKRGTWDSERDPMVPPLLASFHPGWTREVYSDFVRAIDGDRQVPGGQDAALRVMAMMDACRSSMGESVDVGDWRAS